MLNYDPNLIKPGLFNLIVYEDNSDPNDPINYENLNEICANFILNDSDLSVLKKISSVLKKLVLKHPNLVKLNKMKLNCIFLIPKLYSSFHLCSAYTCLNFV